MRFQFAELVLCSGIAALVIAMSLGRSLDSLMKDRTGK